MNRQTISVPVYYYFLKIHYGWTDDVGVLKKISMGVWILGL